MIDSEPKTLLRILHLEDNAIDAALVRDALDVEGIGCDIRRTETREDFEAALREGAFDIVLSD